MEYLPSVFEYWEVISSVVSLAALGVVFYLSKTYVRHGECADCRKELEGRCEELEAMQQSYAEGRAGMAQQLAAMPRATDVHELRVAIERLSGDFRAVQATIAGQGEMLKAVKSQGDRMNGYLMEKH